VVDTIFANHPGFTLSYRISCGANKLVYMTDNELDSVMGSQRQKYVEFISKARLLIHDAQYTKEEYAARKGWGHSSWPKALDLALAGQVERLALFHHDPDHTDADIDLILEACRTRAREQGAQLDCLAAQEGMEIVL
jgi:phosphoribosyl 1,2-cyclic phosphodiesterase